jgi:hypothetical protein
MTWNQQRRPADHPNVDTSLELIEGVLDYIVRLCIFPERGSADLDRVERLARHLNLCASFVGTVVPVDVDGLHPAGNQSAAAADR